MDWAGEPASSSFEQNGVKYSFETGGLAPVADGSCLAKAGKTWVHAVVSQSDANVFHEKIKPTVNVSAGTPLTVFDCLVEL